MKAIRSWRRPTRATRPAAAGPNSAIWIRPATKKACGLAHRIAELIASLVYRVESLLAAGWREVRIVTDHGWLLLPGGLPKTDLPKYLTATRWRRCAVVKESADVDLPCFPWFWADKVRIACPPGIGLFMAGEEYSHGGLSLQECVVPQLTVLAGAQPAVSAKIESVKWTGLRCRVKVAGQFDGLQGRPAGQSGRPDDFAAIDMGLRPVAFEIWAKMSAWTAMSPWSFRTRARATHHACLARRGRQRHRQELGDGWG